ncbi:MAG: hypothetical protein Kow002_18360 [Anaerolineales bacterium]
MEISFRGQYDKNLFYKAVVLANRPSRSRRIMNGFLLAFILAAGVVIAQRAIESDFALDVYSYAALSILLGVAVFQVVVFFQPRFAARTLWNNPSVQRPLKGTISNRGITYSFPQGQNHIPWENINRMQRNASMVTFVTITGLMLVFPSRFFKNDSDWRRFNALIDKKVVVVK